MTIPDDKAERADGPSNAELAKTCRNDIVPYLRVRGMAHLADMAERAAQRLETETIDELRRRALGPTLLEMVAHPESADVDFEPPRLSDNIFRDALKIELIGGNCPVQAEGTIDGERFYFRARGEHWSMGIGGSDPVGNPFWYHCESWGDGPFAAGWMEENIARQLIDRCAADYLRQRRPDITKTEEKP